MKKIMLWLGSLAIGAGIHAQASTSTFSNVHGQKTIQTSENVTTQPTSTEWQLVETINGVSCYSKIAPMGTGTGVYLRFVNTSGENVTVNWSVTSGNKIVRNGKVAIDAGQTVDSANQPADSELLVVRVDADQPVISFTVSK